MISALRNNGVITDDQRLRRTGAPALIRFTTAPPPGSSGQKLQQSQEIVTARVQPLRVNLPVRGQHFAFTQVLQTEGGRPMTIQLFAASTKAVSWPMRSFDGVVAFLALWGLVAILSRLTLRGDRVPASV